MYRSGNVFSFFLNTRQSIEWGQGMGRMQEMGKDRSESALSGKRIRGERKQCCERRCWVSKVQKGEREHCIGIRL